MLRRRHTIGPREIELLAAQMLRQGRRYVYNANPSNDVKRISQLGVLYLVVAYRSLGCGWPPCRGKGMVSV